MRQLINSASGLAFAAKPLDVSPSKHATRHIEATMAQITPLPDALAERLAPLLKQAEPPTPKRRRRRAGQQEWDWPGAQKAVCKALKAKGFKPTGAHGEQAEIARQLADYFIQKVDECPVEFTMQGPGASPHSGAPRSPGNKFRRH